MTGDPPLALPIDALGRPMRDLRISVMDRCNFRCTYCMPAATFHEGYRFLASEARLNFDEIVRLTGLALQLGVRKVRLTGGEPLLRANLHELIGDLSLLRGIDDLALTTNGVLLTKHALELKSHGLQRLTVSLDSLDEATFLRMSGGHGSVRQVLDGVEAAIAAGFAPIKINAVVERGVNDQNVLDLIEHFRGRPVVVRLIEFMDVGNRNAWTLDQVVPMSELLSRAQARWELSALQPSYRGEVAERWRFMDAQGGEMGFISSVSQPFCADCSRLRLSSDGKLYSCLFSAVGLDLKTPLRGGASDDELLSLIRRSWTERRDRYSEERLTTVKFMPRKKVEMYYIGG